MLKLNNILLKVFLCIFIFTNSYIMANEANKLPEIEEHLKFNSQNHILTDYQQEALSYLLEPESSNWNIKETQGSCDSEIKIITLEANSLIWPKKDATISSNHSQWKHRVIIYIPQNANRNTALLYIGNGLLYPTAEHPDSNVNVDFKKIALDTNSIVIEARDIPNQFLSFTEKHGDKELQTDGKREDDLFIYTWMKYIEDPQAHAYMPLHMAMAKSAMRIMTICQDFLQVKYNIKIDNFVLTGTSKRGWTAWLVAAFDYRISAIIPTVADYLDLNKLIPLLLEPHNKNYVGAKIAYIFKDYLHSKNMQKLINLIDPVHYNNFLDMPKYLISSSGDRFVPPETNQNFIGNISNKNLRIVPNKGHGIEFSKEQILTSSIQAFYGRFVSGKELPQMESSLENNLIKISSSIAPKKAILHNLNSNDRNFILEYDKNAYQINSTDLKIDKGKTKFEFPITEKSDKWQFNIIELQYDNHPYDDLIITTPAYITPKM